jgi:hypothetical protein
VLARQAEAALFRLADTLFAAFARAGEDGLTAERIRSACAAFPANVIDNNRLGVLRKLGAIQPAFDKPYQREYRASRRRTGPPPSAMRPCAPGPGSWALEIHGRARTAGAGVVMPTVPPVSCL